MTVDVTRLPPPFPNMALLIVKEAVEGLVKPFEKNKQKPDPKPVVEISSQGSESGRSATDSGFRASGGNTVPAERFRSGQETVADNESDSQTSFASQSDDAEYGLPRVDIVA